MVSQDFDPGYITEPFKTLAASFPGDASDVTLRTNIPKRLQDRVGPDLSPGSSGRQRENPIPDLYKCFSPIDLRGCRYSWCGPLQN